jgi:hypothetical protein
MSRRIYSSTAFFFEPSPLVCLPLVLAYKNTPTAYQTSPPGRRLAITLTTMPHVVWDFTHARLHWQPRDRILLILASKHCHYCTQPAAVLLV